MPNDVIKQIKILNPDAPGGYELKDISAEAANIDVTYKSATSDLQTAITGLETELAGVGHPDWDQPQTAPDGIRNKDNVYSEQHKFGTGYAEAEVLGTFCSAAMTGYVRRDHAIVVVKFDRLVVPNSSLNINNTGYKPIYYKGAALTDPIIKADDMVTFIYDDAEDIGSGDHGAYKIISIDTGTETFEFDPDALDFDYNSSTGAFKLNQPVFSGTTQEWADCQNKSHYDGGIVNLTDDTEGIISDITDTVQVANMNAVTSNAVALKTDAMAAELAGDIELSNTAAYPHSIGDYIHYVNSDGVPKFAVVNTAIVVGDTISDKVTDTNVSAILHTINSNISTLNSNMSNVGKLEYIMDIPASTSPATWTPDPKYRGYVARANISGYTFELSTRILSSNQDYDLLLSAYYNGTTYCYIPITIRPNSTSYTFTGSNMAVYSMKLYGIL